MLCFIFTTCDKQLVNTEPEFLVLGLGVWWRGGGSAVVKILLCHDVDFAIEEKFAIIETIETFGKLNGARIGGLFVE